MAVSILILAVTLANHGTKYLNPKYVDNNGTVQKCMWVQHWPRALIIVKESTICISSEGALHICCNKICFNIVAA